MNHEKYKEMLQLLLYDELEQKEKIEIQDHLATCSECQKELSDLQHLHSTLKHRSIFEPSDKALMEARTELKSKLN